MIDELSGVMKDEDRPLGRGQAAGGCREVAGQDLRLADPIIVEEAISGLGGGPVLAGQRQARSHRPAELLQEPPQPLAQPRIGKGRSGEFLIEPRGAFEHRIHGTPPSEWVPNTESRPSHVAQAEVALAPEMWVIESARPRLC